MGQLKPGATYIYERADGITYARESGADPSTRTAIGWDYVYRTEKSMRNWADILKAAEENPALQEAIDRVQVIYELSKDE